LAWIISRIFKRTPITRFVGKNRAILATFIDSSARAIVSLVSRNRESLAPATCPFSALFILQVPAMSRNNIGKRAQMKRATRNWPGRLLNFDVFGTNISIDDARVARNSSRVRRVALGAR